MGVRPTKDLVGDRTAIARLGAVVAVWNKGVGGAAIVRRW